MTIGSGTMGWGRSGSCPPPLANKGMQTVQNPPTHTFGALCETLYYVLLDCFNVWAATMLESRVGGSGVEIACPVKCGSKWSLGRCVYTLCLR